MLIGDCASDAPLEATARALATWRADDVVYGLGAMALARKHRALGLAVRDETARAALAQAIARVEARVELVPAADAWPAVAAGARDELIPADLLVQVADAARGRARVSYVTVAGAVQAPLVLACAPSTTMAELVARAGGADDEDWVAIARGAPAGTLVARDATLDAVGSPSLVLILPAGHALVRRLRAPVAEWLWRATSACAGCRICSDGCPAALLPHALVATLAAGDSTLLDASDRARTSLNDARDRTGLNDARDRTGLNDARDRTAAADFLVRSPLRDGLYGAQHTPAEAARCTGCGLCDAVCPSALSPRALMVAARDRLRAGGLDGAATTLSVGLDRTLLTLRLDLTRYDRPVSMESVRA